MTSAEGAQLFNALTAQTLHPGVHRDAEPHLIAIN
jgi:hypothetical protein